MSEKTKQSKKSKAIVAPSLLAADFGNLNTDIASVVKAGANWLHIDVMDGAFVPPITFGDNMVAQARSQTKLFLDVHLMINRPYDHLEVFAKAGSDRIIVHQEVCPHLQRTLQNIKDLGLKNGVALNPGTPIETVFEVLGIADLVLIMTVNPGWGGQKFLPHCLSKIERLSKEISRQGSKTLIEVDGGINAKTAQACWSAGATAFVAGSYIFGSQNRELAIQKLHQVAD